VTSIAKGSSAPDARVYSSSNTVGLDGIAKEPFLKTDSPAAAVSRRSLIGKLAIPIVVAAILAGFGLGYWYYASSLASR
jgi:hypothetical protein